MRMGLDANGNRVPIIELMSPEDLKIYEDKHLKRTGKKVEVQKKIDATEAKETPATDVVLTGKPCPDGTVECHRPDESCGLRKEHYCIRAPESMCDIDMEKADVASGSQVLPPKGGGPAKEIGPAQGSNYTEKSSSELKAQLAAHTARFDKFDQKQLKAKCKKLDIRFKGNLSKAKLIGLLKTELDGPAESESAASKL